MKKENFNYRIFDTYTTAINIPSVLDELQTSIKKQIELQKQMTILENKINTSITLIKKEIKDLE